MSVFLGIIPRGEASFQVLRLGPPASSVPSIFFFWGLPSKPGPSLAKGIRVEASFPQASSESKEGWPGGLLKDRAGPWITWEAQKRWRAHYRQSLSQAPPCLLSFMILRLQRKEVFFAFSEEGKLLSLPLGNSKRRSSLSSTTARAPIPSVPSIFFGPPPVLPGLSLAKGPRGSLPSPQAS